MTRTMYPTTTKLMAVTVARDNRYLPAKEQWSTVLGDLKRMALEEDTPEKIALFLRERRDTLLGNTIPKII